MLSHVTQPPVLRLSVSCLQWPAWPRDRELPASCVTRNWSRARPGELLSVSSQCPTLAQRTRDGDMMWADSNNNVWHSHKVITSSPWWWWTRWTLSAHRWRWPGPSSASPWPRWVWPPDTGPRRPPPSLSPHSHTCQKLTISQQVSYTNIVFKKLFLTL